MLMLARDDRVSLAQNTLNNLAPKPLTLMMIPPLVLILHRILIKVLLIYNQSLVMKMGCSLMNLLTRLVKSLKKAMPKRKQIHPLTQRPSSRKKFTKQVIGLRKYKNKKQNQPRKSSKDNKRKERRQRRRQKNKRRNTY